jgi:hypothetical protein
MTSIDLLIQCLLDSKISWCGQCSPKFTSHVTSCGPPSFVFIQMYLFWLLFILLSLEGWSLSVCYNICDYHWFWFSPIAVVGWYVNVSKLQVSDFSWCQVTDAGFITPTLLCHLPFSRLVFFVSIPLHDGCISCRLYNMYLFFCCSDLCPLLRYQ